MSYRVLGVAEDWVTVDGARFANLPAGGLAGGLGGLLERVAPQLAGGEGTILLTAGAAGMLGLSGPDDVSVQVGAAAGWRVGEVSAWCSPYRVKSRAAAGVTVHVCVLPWLLEAANAERWPWPRETTEDAAAGSDRLVEVAWQLADYDRAVGAMFRARPGVPGLAAMRAMAVPPRSGKPPLWRSQNGPHRSVAELALVWEREETPAEQALSWRHDYDLNASRLAAAGVAVLARDPLRNTGPQVFDRGLCGYWSVPLAPVRALEDQRRVDGEELRPPLVSRLADQVAGAGAGDVWLTTPTVALLEDLGLPPEIHDSWTAKGFQLLRNWADRLNMARSLTTRERALNKAVKRTYAEAIGMLNSESGRVFRPDWFHTIVAQERANLIRKVDAIGEKSSRWPIAVDTDCLTYASGNAGWGASAPSGMVCGPDLGQFHEKE